MGIFDDACADDGRFTFADGDAIGAESVTYTPYGGAAQTNNVIIERIAPDLDEQGNAHPQVEIWIPNSSTSTVGVESVTVGGDTVALPLRYGDSSTITLTVAEIIEQDGGMWHLLVK